MKYGTLITDARKAARRTLNEVSDAVGVSRHVLRAVERGANPPFARPYANRLIAFLDISADEVAAVERAWRAEQVQDMTPRATGHGLARPTPTREQAIAAVEAQVERARAAGQAVRESGRRIMSASSAENRASFSGSVGEVRTHLLSLLRRQGPDRRISVTVTVGGE